MTKDEKVYDGKYLELIQRRFVRKDGQTAVWEMVRRKVFGPIILVTALTPHDEVILVKIFRIPLQAYVLESVAGLMDIQGETPKDAARRELLEETGYEVKELDEVARGPFNAGLHPDEVALFIGTDAMQIAAPRLDESEDITVVKIPLHSLASYLRCPPKDLKIDMKLFAVLWWLENFKKPRK